MRPASPSSRRVSSTPRLARVLLTLALALPVRAEAEALLEVQGTVLATTPRIVVRIDVANRGNRAAAPLEITGELLGERCESRLDHVAPGGRASVLLDFAEGGARSGVHALALLLEHPTEGAPDGAGNPPVASRRVALGVAIRQDAAPAVRLEPRAAQLDVAGRLAISVSSADGAPHRVRLRALPARGLRSEGKGVSTDVPARGTAVAEMPLVRAGAPFNSRHVVPVVAETEDGALARTSVVDATVEVAPDRSLLRRFRHLVLAAALLLLAIAAAAEAFRRSHHGA